MESPGHTRKPVAAPVVVPQTFPIIPPAPFGLTDDLFTAIHLRPLFIEHVGNPDVVDTSTLGEKDSPSDGNPGSSTAIKPEDGKLKGTKREWKKPPLHYDSLLGGLPDPRPLAKDTKQLLPLIHGALVPPPSIPDPPGFVRQDMKGPGFRFDPILDPKSMTDIGVVTLKEGKARGVKDVYTNGQKNPRRAKGGPAGNDPNRSRRRKENQKARNEYHARNRATAPGQLEHSMGSNYDIAVGSPRTPGTPGTPRSRTPTTPGYRPGSRVGTPSYVRQQ